MDDTKFEGLAGLVAEVDAAGPQTPEQQAEAAAADDLDTQGREWGVIAYTIGSALAMLAPELRQVYTEDACAEWGRSAALVGQKYGWDGPSNVPEVGLLISTAGLAVPSFLLIRARLASLKAEQAKQRAEPGEVVSEQGNSGGG